MKIHQFASNQEQTVKLAKTIANRIYELLKNQPQVWIAFSGGKSPVSLFNELNNYDLAWKNVVVTLVDERFTDTSSVESNERLIREHLLINKAEKAFFIGLVQNGSSILDCVKNANLHLRKIDLAVLGMGEDGHTASIFPCCKELKDVLDAGLFPEKYIITTPTTAKYQRIGLSLRGLLEIPQLFVSINGDKKLAIFKEAMQNISYTYPISHVLAKHPNVEMYWYQ